VASLEHPTEEHPKPGKGRVRAAALAGLAGLVLMQLVAPAALAQEADEPPPLVKGRGESAFGVDAADPLAGLVGCRFQTEVMLVEGVATGSFQCRVSDDAVLLGVPFSILDGTVTASSDVTPHQATLSGTATLQLPDLQILEDVGFTGVVREGQAGVGGLRVFVLGMFDGSPGDTVADDGNYSLPRQTLSEGRLRVEWVSEPDPDPEPDPEPEPDPDPAPDPERDQDEGNGNGGQGGVQPPVAVDPGLIADALPPPTGTASTARLMALLAQASPTGVPLPDDILSVVGPFPVAGLSWWRDDWHAYRCCPYEHLHRGLDMFAARGTPVVAAADGTISQKVNGSVSGLGVEITDASGTQYFYAHLDGFATGLARGQSVRRGDVVGYVGNTGNARGTSSHLHFEIQPGGIPVPPKPRVDLWLAMAEAKAEALVEQRTGEQAQETPDVLTWLNRARGLAGDSWGELSGEGLAPKPVQAAPAARRAPVSSGEMILFSAGMFLLVLVGPGVAGGRRQARRLRTRPVPAADIPAPRRDPERAGSRMRAAR
jgi:murein DD-endopeptidase MepM/ murein hydrolase activator NlpD